MSFYCWSLTTVGNQRVQGKLKWLQIKLFEYKVLWQCDCTPDVTRPIDKSYSLCKEIQERIDHYFNDLPRLLKWIDRAPMCTNIQHLKPQNTFKSSLPTTLTHKTHSYIQMKAGLIDMIKEDARLRDYKAFVHESWTSKSLLWSPGVTSEEPCEAQGRTLNVLLHKVSYWA